ncbi:MAG: 23S rRNA (adenine(2503)-C(2))-methyltransferase RlmN [Verrucomicrobiota bacterium]|nr:23S rRNA (adenine(2503)-C(2))-methyltransferase RlmN [Verrucomicrobiales bacterium]MED5470776.1 23S rRNA (adenine(2503)-C(2))-methyltransferase RlmN [Verrucomicrobiota bacterium]MEE2967049.1 23S rRNA (adenine(2503)-C(2))-methyltransferase RlmN [Verrucomicrobiota bacterium]
MNPGRTITGLTKEEIEHDLLELGEPKYRASQVIEWVYNQRVTKFGDMSNLPEKLRERLSSTYTINSLTPVHDSRSNDTTKKYLYQLQDGRYIESVIIPASTNVNGNRSSRQTLCVSSQVGCAYGCKFCASGLDGFTRNLETSEIIGQVLAVEEESKKKINNIVFMGMGEPLANLENLMHAIKIINADWGLGIGARHITVSTSGLAPEIMKIADQPLQIRLAVSLHGASDDVREKIMPINKKYPLNDLIESLQYYNSKKKHKITFEYILIKGVNDSEEQANSLAKLASSLRAKVNLIPYNKVEELHWERPSETAQKNFLNILTKKRIQATLRKEKGHDIEAACGQLRLKKERSEVTKTMV